MSHEWIAHQMIRERQEHVQGVRKSKPRRLLRTPRFRRLSL
ncbi:MAG TPA: hypothetical protein VMT27_08005 [Actinomycetes bacterium]|nr:hypothetical protein [Actinomycetes bacterium]